MLKLYLKVIKYYLEYRGLAFKWAEWWIWNWRNHCFLTSTGYIPLERAGFLWSFWKLTQQWQSLSDYSMKYQAPGSTSYYIVWRKIFNSSRKKLWSCVLLVVELFFTLPVSNTKVERLFSLMNRIKTDSRTSLSQPTLSALIRICMECPKCDLFDQIPGIPYGIMQWRQEDQTKVEITKKENTKSDQKLWLMKVQVHTAKLINAAFPLCEYRKLSLLTFVWINFVAKNHSLSSLSIHFNFVLFQVFTSHSNSNSKHNRFYYNM